MHDIPVLMHHGVVYSCELLETNVRRTSCTRRSIYTKVTCGFYKKGAGITAWILRTRAIISGSIIEAE
jgi:hypothetical protein